MLLNKDPFNWGIAACGFGAGWLICLFVTSETEKPKPAESPVMVVTWGLKNPAMKNFIAEHAGETVTMKWDRSLPAPPKHGPGERDPDARQKVYIRLLRGGALLCGNCLRSSDQEDKFCRRCGTEFSDQVMEAIPDPEEKLP